MLVQMTVVGTSSRRRLLRVTAERVTPPGCGSARWAMRNSWSSLMPSASAPSPPTTVSSPLVPGRCHRSSVKGRNAARLRFCSLTQTSQNRLLAHEWRGAIVAMTTDSLRNVKDRFSEFVDRVEGEHERIVVTRNGRPAAVLISPDDLESLEETLDLLSDQTAIRELVEAQAAVAVGDVVRGVDAVRSLRPSSAK
jgi:antitoxin YefM